MHTNSRYLLGIRLLFCSSVFAQAPANSDDITASDENLRRAIVGTWFREKNAAIASVATYTTFHEDGTVIELIKIKVVFKRVVGTLVESNWDIQHGELTITPIRIRSNTDSIQRDNQPIVRHLVSINNQDMVSQGKEKERTDIRTTIPADAQNLIDELAKVN